MNESTIHLLAKLGRRLGRLAGRHEASASREAVERLNSTEGPRPATPLFRGNDPHLADRVDEALTDLEE